MIYSSYGDYTSANYFNDKATEEADYKASLKTFYSTVGDDNIISEEILNKGDCSVTLYGGHNYEILEDNTLVYEFKTGPYLGVDLDKQTIGEN